MDRKTFLKNLKNSMYSDEFIDKWTKIFNLEPGLIDQCFPMIENINKEYKRTIKLVSPEDILFYTEQLIDNFTSAMKQHDWPPQLIQIIFLNVDTELATKYVVLNMAKNMKTYIIER